MSDIIDKLMAYAPTIRQPPRLADDPMLKYFLTQLDVRTRSLERRAVGPTTDPPVNDPLVTEVRNGLASFFKTLEESGSTSPDDAWNQAYRLERLLSLAEPDDTLTIELQRRLDEAAEEAIPSAARLRIAFDATKPLVLDTAQVPPTLKPGGATRLRAMLLDVLEETHWAFQRKFHSRPIQKDATRRLVSMGLFACGIFVLPYAWLYYSAWRATPGWEPPLGTWSWLPLWTAVTAGFFGAMFSRLLYLQANWGVLSLGALKDARELSSIALRGAVGMSGAVIVFYFLQSGVINGGLFPKFSEICLLQINYPGDSTSGTVPLRLILPNVNLALLVVWSFLAGFSERLVPSILQSTETSLRSAPTNRT